MVHVTWTLVVFQANAEASKVSGKGRRHNIHIKSRQKPFVEYTRGNEDEAGKPGSRLSLHLYPFIYTQGTLV